MENKMTISVEQQAVLNKNKIEKAVTAKIAAMTKAGGIAIPKGYNPGNEIALALLELSDRKEKTGVPTLAAVDSASVAQSLFRMCILGVSFSRKQCAFIKYGDKLQFQLQYHGNIALAKRLGGAAQPRAQVIYEGDEFEYVIDTATGNKVVTKHVQRIGNIDNAKIVGAWCLVPYEDPNRQPFVEVMTINEIRQSWQKGATKGTSDAHVNFTQEMCKKTVINRACKLFITSSDDAGLYESYTDNDRDMSSSRPEEQQAAEVVDINLDALDAGKVAAIAAKTDDAAPEEQSGHEPEPVRVENPAAQQDAEKNDLFNM